MAFDTSCNGKFGNCTYNVRARDGYAVAAWISTANGKPATKTVTYLARGSTGNCTTDRKNRCADARAQFLKENSRLPTADLDIVGNVKDLLTGQRNTDANVLTIKKTGGNSNNLSREQYCKEVCDKSCGHPLVDPGCNYAKWDCQCGGSAEIFPNICAGLPKPFNNCLLTGGVIVGGILLIMLLK